MVGGGRALSGGIALALALGVGGFVAGRVTAPAPSALLATSVANEQRASYAADQLQEAEVRVTKAEAALATAKRAAADLQNEVEDLTTAVAQARAEATRAASVAAAATSATAAPRPTVPAARAAQEAACAKVERARAQALLVFSDWKAERLAGADVERRLRIPAEDMGELSMTVGGDTFGRHVKEFSTLLTDYLARWTGYGPFSELGGIVDDVTKGVPECA